MRESFFLIKSILSVILLTFFTCSISFAGNTAVPVLKNGKKFRIAYYEGGPYTDYTGSMKAIIRGLIEHNWINRTEIPEIDYNTPMPYWEWLCKKAKSPYLEFRSEDAYTGNWDDNERSAVRSRIIKKLQSEKIDLIIAMGTWAGQDLANTRHSVPVIVVSTSNPIEAGIVKSAKDSGLDHVTARVDQERYLRQIRMFHRLTGFKRLGVAYGDTPEDLLYSAIPDVKKAASERGFEVETCKFKDVNTNREDANTECIKCYEKLAENTDAVYVTALLSVDDQLDRLVDLFIKKRIPSFSMLGSKYVKSGILMSLSTDEGYRAQGLYDAEKIIRILTGTKPRDLSQEFPDPLYISVNMDTAGKIGFQVPASILRIANEVYGE